MNQPNTSDKLEFVTQFLIGFGRDGEYQSQQFAAIGLWNQFVSITSSPPTPRQFKHPLQLTCHPETVDIVFPNVVSELQRQYRKCRTEQR